MTIVNDPKRARLPDQHRRDPEQAENRKTAPCVIVSSAYSKKILGNETDTHLRARYVGFPHAGAGTLSPFHVPVSSWTMKIAHMIASTTEPSPNSAPRKFGILLVTCTKACRTRKTTNTQASTTNR
jgi:hypothetical protein